MAMDLFAALSAAASHVQEQRVNAEQWLKNLEEQNLPSYLQALVQELGMPARPIETRQLAGLLLKNSLTARDLVQRQVLAERWLNLPPDVRVQVRGLVLRILEDEQREVRFTAALIVGKIAAIEVPAKAWPELIPGLVHNISTGNQFVRQASFQSLGYVCEEVSEDEAAAEILQEQSSHILNAIAMGMKVEETNDDIKIAATNALKNSMEFVRNNMQREAERNLIMQMIFAATQSKNVQVRVSAYQCLVTIAAVYYDLLQPYMLDIFNLTSSSMKMGADDDEVAQQAIEFWSTICDEELDLIEMANDCRETGAQPSRVCFGYAAAALVNITPLVLMRLTNQSEEVDDQTWNAAMAAGVCLTLMANTCRDQIVQHVLPFVQSNIANPDWRFREAATLAFGCILDGPSPDDLKPLVVQALPRIVSQLKDESDVVKDTSAWTIGRICQFLPESIDPQNAMPALMTALYASLSDVPRVAANVCWAIHNLAENTEVSGKTSLMSPYFQVLVQALLQTTTRSDASEANLLTSSYEAINVLIHTAAPDMYELVGQLMPPLMQRLLETLNSAPTETTNEVQALLCGSLQVIVQKLSPDVVKPNAGNLMQLFLRVLQNNTSAVMEEAMMAVGAVANSVEENFIEFMPAFQRSLLQGLSDHLAYHVCTVSVGVVGDVARALGQSMAPFCDDIMQMLLQLLQNPNMERSVKPHVISCLADIAMGVGGYFERYLEHVAPFLSGACKVEFQNGQDVDNIEYLNTLRESVLEAYTGILQGLDTARKAQLFMGCLPDVLKFMELLARPDSEHEDTVIQKACGLIGDIARSLGVDANVRNALKSQPIEQLAKWGKASPVAATKEAGEWAIKCVQDVSRSK